MLAWMIYFEHIKDATFALKTSYVSQLRQQEATWSAFMEFLFSALGLGIQAKTFDLSRWDVQELDVSGRSFATYNSASNTGMIVF